eukprot:g6990.t1
MILAAIAEYRDMEGVDGVNGSQALGAAMRRLTEDPYLTLGVEPVADEATIKKAYRKLALRYHPDKNKATSTLFQAVQGAHDVLIEPDKRAEYDAKRKRQQEALSRLRKHPRGGAAGATAQSAGTATAGASKSGQSSPAAGAAGSPTGGGATKQSSSPYSDAGGYGGATGSTAGAGRHSKKTSAASGKGAGATGGQPAASSGDEKVRQFNKRFYEEFRREAQKNDKSKSSSRRASGAAPGTSKHEVEEARQRRSQNQAGHTKPSVQFRSSSIAGNDGAEGAEDASSRSKNAAAAGQRNAGGVDSSGGTGGGAGPPGIEKTNSWYWRRMSRAAAQDGRDGGTADGTGKEKAQRRRTMHEQGSPSEGAWACVVCKRQNEPTSNSCWVCYTARSYQPVNLDRIRTDNETSGGPLNSARRSSIGSRSRSRSTTPTEDATKPNTQPPSKVEGENAKTSGSEPGAGVSEKVPSIRVYSVPSQGPGSARGAGDGDGIRVSASTAQPASDTAAAGEGGARDPADVWEFTEGDLDNIGGGPTTYGSDDEWSYASGAGGLDTKSDPGEADTYRRRSSTGGVKQRRESSHTGTTAAGRGRHGGDHGDGDDEDGAAPPKRYLNGRITKLHNVRAEPIRDAKVVGYLIATKEVQVLAEVGEWFKVRWHKRAKDKTQQDDTPSSPSSSSSKKSTGTTAPEAAAASSSATSTPRSSMSATAGEKEKNGGGGGGGGREAGEADGMEEASEDGAEKGTGWCVTRDKKHQYIVTIGPEDPNSAPNRRPSSAKSSRGRSSTGRRRSSVTAGRTSEGLEGGGSASVEGAEGGDGAGDGGGVFGEDGEEGECWHELKDEDGSVYYFNAVTGISQWEPPVWIDEIDPTTGAVYYVNSYTGDPQWERPEDFVPIVRENPYATTPEQDFIKSVLSPKRSKGPKSFHEAMYKAARSGGSAQHLNTVSEGVAGGGGNEQPKDAAAA